MFGHPWQFHETISHGTMYYSLMSLYYPENRGKISPLIALQELGELKIFRADLTDEASFDAPISRSDIVFHVATPVNFSSDDPEVQCIWCICVSSFMCIKMKLLDFQLQVFLFSIFFFSTD